MPPLPPPPNAPKPVPPRLDDELDELPPMDGEAEDEGELRGLEDELDDDPTDPGDPFDDSTGEGDPLDEIEVDGDESGWLDDTAEAEGLDIGAPDLGEEEEHEKSDLLEGAEEPGVEEDDDFALAGDESQASVDAGEEGFDGEDEELREEDLPRLDAGDDGDVSDANLVDAWMLGREDDSDARLEWDEGVWERAGAPLQLGEGAIDAVACAGRSVLVAGGGSALTRVDLEGGVEPLEAFGLRGGTVRAIFASNARVLVTTARAGVFASRDGGATFTEANGWRATVTRADADGPIEIVGSARAIWGRTRGGALVRSRDGGESWSRIGTDRRIAAIALDGDALVALSVEGTASIGRDAGEQLGWSVLAPLPELQPGAPIAVALRGRHVAVCVEERGVWLADGVEGGPWRHLPGSGRAIACTFIDDEGTLVLAIYSAAEERAWLARSAAGAPPRLVAEIGDASPDDADARVRALVWDDAHGVAWAAGGFGLVALHPARRSI